MPGVKHIKNWLPEITVTVLLTLVVYAIKLADTAAAQASTVDGKLRVVAAEIKLEVSDTYAPKDECNSYRESTDKLLKEIQSNTHKIMTDIAVIKAKSEKE